MFDLCMFENRGKRQRVNRSEFLASIMGCSVRFTLAAFTLSLCTFSFLTLIAVYKWGDQVMIEEGSTVAKLLKQFPNSLESQRIIHLLRPVEFRKRTQHFATQTLGLLREERTEAVQAGLCPEVGSVSVSADKELGYSLEAYLGQAYYLHLIDCLNSTSGFEGTAPFFFFNPQHGLLPEQTGDSLWDFRRSFNAWNAFQVNWKRMPAKLRRTFHNPVRTDQYPMSGLVWPPFSAFYSNDFLERLKTMYGRRIAIISGKHRPQWKEKQPVNTFARPEDLQPILDALLDNNYVVIYARQRHKFKGETKEQKQGQDPGDYELIRELYFNKPVVTLEDLWAFVSTEPFAGDPTIFNLFQLAVYQQASTFIDTQGGGAVVSSLMPGDHFILHVKGSELIRGSEKQVGGTWSYTRWWRHGGGRFFVYDTPGRLAAGLRSELQGATYASNA
eukprot:Protomagalhaensia_sp_Gyna_25__2636@NODE_24_length_7526_cov_33_797783_g17_i0_p2_GENE_NODE_24_length_7526_cov_33_797783_g17_i0NODE_24_length_7526_cov_33_797783_g17_i0_p2_ORF_typecomplete_len444_score47_07DUF1422/PF07226_11/0_22Chlamy_scaf/PF09675_10/1e04Chlamy_scaf/PF09675_10/0_55_NODE_24_length_7526_cov_33_797783_g17_i022933624